MNSLSSPAMILSSVDLPGAVDADHADLGARVEVEVDVLEHFLLAVVLGQVRDVEDVALAHEFLV